MLEAILAVVLLGIGLIGAVGMQARAYSAISDAGVRAEAAMAADKLVGIMNTDVANLPSYVLAESGTPNATLAPWAAETRRAIPGATLSVTVQPLPRRYQVDVLIKWRRRNGGDLNQQRVTAYIAI